MFFAEFQFHMPSTHFYEKQTKNAVTIGIAQE